MSSFGKDFEKITPQIKTIPRIPEESTIPNRIDSILGPGPFYLSKRDFDEIVMIIQQESVDPTISG